MPDDAIPPFGDGWLTGPETEEAKEQAAAMAEEAQRQVEDEARLVHDVFTQGRGPELLAKLRSRTIDQALLSHANTMPMGDISISVRDWVLVRGGQNSVIHFIEAMISRAQQPPEQPKQQRKGSSK